jgi:hypothetical protein
MPCGARVAGRPVVIFKIFSWCFIQCDLIAKGDNLHQLPLQGHRARTGSVEKSIHTDLEELGSGIDHAADGTIALHT